MTEAPKLLNPGWVEYTDSAAQLHVPYPVWLAVRAALGLLSLAAGAAFLALLPEGRTRWTALGAASLCSTSVGGRSMRNGLLERLSSVTYTAVVSRN